MRNAEYAIRAKSLGNLGELLAIKALVDNGYLEIRNLNDKKNNHPFADLYAVKNDMRYLFSVKSRNKYQVNGVLNSRYNLLYSQVDVNAICAEYQAAPYWMAIQFHGEHYSVYIGSLFDLAGKRAIPMTVNHTLKYECLVNNVKHGIDFRPYSNALFD